MTSQAPQPKKRNTFSKEEDDRLLALYQEHPEDWNAIAAEMNRSSRQVRERYQNYLDPKLNTDPWTPEEEALLDHKVQQIGTHWAKISPYFSNRSEVNIKNHWATMINRRYHNKNKRVLLPSELASSSPPMFRHHSGPKPFPNIPFNQRTLPFCPLPDLSNQQNFQLPSLFPSTGFPPFTPSINQLPTMNLPPQSNIQQNLSNFPAIPPLMGNQFQQTNNFDGSFFNQGTFMNNSFPNQGTSMNNSFPNQGSSMNNSFPNQGCSMNNSFPNQGCSANGSFFNQGGSMDNSNINQGSFNNNANFNLGSSMANSNLNLASSMDNPNFNLGNSMDNSNLNLPSSMEISNFNIESPLDNSNTTQQNPKENSIFNLGSSLDNSKISPQNSMDNLLSQQELLMNDSISNQEFFMEDSITNQEFFFDDPFIDQDNSIFGPSPHHENTSKESKEESKEESDNKSTKSLTEFIDLSPFDHFSF